MFAYGPNLDTGDRSVQEGRAYWEVVDDQVHLWCTVPGTTVGAAGDDVFRALLGVRRQLEVAGWLLLVQGARHDAWHTTPEHPCPVDEAVLYPVVGQPPAKRVRVLDAEPDVEFLAHTVVEQVMYRHEWAGTTPPGEPTWSQATASRREVIAARKRGDA